MAYYLDLFDGNPAHGGISVLDAITGSAVRTDVTSQLTQWTARSLLTNTDVLSVSSASLSQTNVSYVALYSAASSGSLLYSAAIGASQVIALNNPVQFLALQLSFPLSIAFFIMITESSDTMISESGATMITE